MLLEIKDLWVHYGRAEALKGISIEIGEGSIATLVGANGLSPAVHKRKFR